MGRPRKRTKLEDLQAQIDKYFNEYVDEHHPMTIQGLAYELGVDDDTLNERGKGLYDSDEEGNIQDFSGIIKRAKRKILVDKVEKLESLKTTPVGLIFSLKNNHGRSDKKEVEMSGNIGISKIMEDIIQ